VNRAPGSGDGEEVGRLPAEPGDRVDDGAGDGDLGEEVALQTALVKAEREEYIQKRT
jgi:hypothetical protein